MKARGSDVRFLLVSATVPNIDDVASWIGNSNSGSAKTFEVFFYLLSPVYWDIFNSWINVQFGEEYRPCKLTRFVYPVSKLKGSNDWMFASILDQKLFPILQQHSVNKPILVFCPTRKGVTLIIALGWTILLIFWGQDVSRPLNFLRKNMIKPWNRKGLYLGLSLQGMISVNHHLVECPPDQKCVELIINSMIKSWPISHWQELVFTMLD